MQQPLLHLGALTQGWTSTSWLVANTLLLPRHGSAIFTAAISHFAAFGILLAAACASNWQQGLGAPQLWQAARAVPHKLAFAAGLGWTSTLFMVMASARLGAALAQVLVVTGELVTACAVDAASAAEGRREGRCGMLGSVGLALAGVALSVADEASQEASHKAAAPSAAPSPGLGLLPVVALAFGCGSCLVLNSLGNTHLRHQLGALNASASSAFVASLGNAAIWVVAEVAGLAHFRSDSSPSTFLLWGVVGLSSSWMVFVVTFIPHRIGFAMTFCLIVAGKTSGGLLVDALGIGGRRRPITPRRGMGVAAVFLGAVLQKLCKQPEAAATAAAAAPAGGAPRACEGDWAEEGSR